MAASILQQIQDLLAAGYGNVKEAIQSPGTFHTRALGNLRRQIEENPEEVGMNWTGGGLGGMTKPVKNLNKYLKGSAVPQRVYHGTKNFDEYSDIPEQAFTQFSNRPNWFSEDPYLANTYSGPKGTIYPANISAKNPLKLNFDANDDVKAAFPIAKNLGIDIKNILEMQKPEKAWELISSPSFVDAAERAGYDSMIINESGYKTIGVFNPTQIKSAIGNRGTYDPTTPDITKKEGGLVYLR